MKVEITLDSYYPFLQARQEDGFAQEPVVEMSEEDWREYQRFQEEFERWQQHLSNLRHKL